jgi:type VI secretion system protein ImpA
VAELDLERLLQPIAGDAPSGPNLEYDPEWTALEQASRGKPEQQLGDTIVAAEAPKWEEIEKRAGVLLTRAKDLRVAVLLARARLNQSHFPSLLVSLQLLHQLAVRFWDTVHPQLDPQDNNDPTMRMNALAALGDGDGMLRELRNALLVQSRSAGNLSVRQIEIALGKLQPRPGEEVIGEPQVDSLLAAAAAENPALPQLLAQTFTEAQALSALLNEKVGAERAPDLKSFLDVLAGIHQFGQRLTSAGTTSDGTDATGAASGAPVTAGGKPISGDIRSRRDAALMLDKICEFLQRSEPAHPAPLLLQRAKRLLDMSFIDIIKDMLPDGVAQVENLAGIKKE